MLCLYDEQRKRKRLSYVSPFPNQNSVILINKKDVLPPRQENLKPLLQTPFKGLMIMSHVVQSSTQKLNFLAFISNKKALALKLS